MDDDYIGPINDSNLTNYTLNGKTILCSDYKFFIIERVNEIIQNIYKEEPIITDDVLRTKVINILSNTKYLVGPTEEELKRLDINDIIDFITK